jgi:KamA family protein
MTDEAKAKRFFGRADLEALPQLQRFDARTRREMLAAATVFPFRVNRYVLEELIDWDAAPDDPIFQLTFPQPQMLKDDARHDVVELIKRDAPREELQATCRSIQDGLNPHPAGQRDLNAPFLDGRPLPGMQHKYDETVLFFPAQGQSCHSYCTYCFRWPQFVGAEDLKLKSATGADLADYLRVHPEASDVLFTGGDPMVMKASLLRGYIEPLLDPALEHVSTIRIGTKSPVYWPHRYLDDDDADDVLRLFEDIVAAGRHLALNVHYTHPRELSTDKAQRALERIRATGAVVRGQAPIIRHVNDDAATWAELWRTEVRLGVVPYYCFVERDTGAKHYFEVPLVRCLEIFQEAYRHVTGLARTVRGPSMSATPGKVLVDGVAEVRGEKVFVLKFLQGRNAEWVGRPFFAAFDDEATWLDHLKPAFGEDRFFYEDDLDEMKRQARARWAALSPS